MEADPERFETDWPAEITYDELVPYYAKVREAMAVRPIPAGQRTHRFELLRRAAEKLNHRDRFESVPLAITFDDAYSYDLDDPIDAKHAKPITNIQGVEQNTCVHLGNCDIGCDVHAKNTLDLNYIPAAEKKGAEVRTLHQVRYVEPIEGGYRVVWDTLTDGRKREGSATAERVVLAAGSLGSTEILLRCRDQYKTLKSVSQRLGEQWSGNANFLTPALYPKDVEVNQGIGPTISAGMTFMDGSVRGQRFYIEDDGFPNLLLNAIDARIAAGGLGAFGARLLRRRLGAGADRGLDEKNPASQLMVWLGEGIDAADGKLSLGRHLTAPWRREVKLRWSSANSKPVIDAILDLHKQIASVEGGKLQIPFYWRFLRSLVSVHPLGGCAMASTPEEGVVDHRGEVFGHPNLFVADGAVLPTPTGRNPSMTIGALAERVADLMAREA
jgi:cholesterol oxidase